jgi:hypothetical protein
MRCGHCTENNYRQLFLDHGCEILNYEKCTKITYRCNCGNVLTRQASHFINNKTCVNCRVAWNFKEDKQLARPGLQVWKRELLKRDGYSCIGCDSIHELKAHHIEAYFLRPDLVSDLNNGIILCGTCHLQAHAMFGWNVGLSNLEHLLGKQISFREAHYACLNTTGE